LYLARLFCRFFFSRRIRFFFHFALIRTQLPKVQTDDSAALTNGAGRPKLGLLRILMF
jgi:hypothetical protein